ncbi:extracellular solute-binding protein [Paenibacillus doosanensis]|uniref:ABC transporter substrate-binding protein n=1 Tax=Paenibacillus doosanensis TaxID=1229154 RepID=UPI00218026FC|nr:extracellular solute-binding protein [Paenibacillus doosanensis]MCS7460646.1 extracellular solute-binding protein [Paenibacillus doosanensis]
MKLAQRKLSGALLSSAMLMTLFTGCSKGGQEAPAQAVEAVSDKGGPVQTEPVDITFYRPSTGTTQEQFMDLMGNAIKAKFPNVNLKFIPYGQGTNVEEVLTAGSDIDLLILNINLIAQFPKYNLLQDVSDSIKKANFDLSRLEPTTVDFIDQFTGGKINALPIFTTAQSLVYNKDIFDKFGVPYPQEGMTWDELYELAKKVSKSDNGIQYYGFAGSTPFSSMTRVNQKSIAYVDPKTNKSQIAGEEFKKVVDNFARFYRIPGAEFPKDKMGKENDMFNKDRNLAMYVGNSSLLINSAVNMNVDAISLPSFSDAKGVGPQMYPTYAAVSSISKHKDIAFQILTYLTSDEMQEKFARDGTGLPIIKDQKVVDLFGADLEQLKGKNMKSFYPQKPAPIAMKTPYDDKVEGKVSAAFKEVVGGDSDVNTAFRKAAEQADADIDAAIKASSAGK